MKAYKIRSLIYLSCFIIAAVVYYHIEQEENFQNSVLASQTADLQTEDQSSKEVEEELAEDLK
ncbi:MAG: hypothetical protein AAF039_16300 [Bacteroidota bacterium]